MNRTLLDGQMVKLLLLSPKTFPGVVSALKNLAGIVEGVEFRYLESVIYRGPELPDGRARRGYQKLQRKLGLFDLALLRDYGDHIILGGWTPLYESLLEALNRSGVRPSLMWCSTLGQSEMTRTEIPSLLSVLRHLEEGRIRHLVLHRRLAQFRDLFGPLRDSGSAVDVPHAIDLARTKASSVREFDGLNADLFCPIRTGKNVLTQLAGAKLARTEFTLHANLSVDWFGRMAALMDVKTVIHPWLDETEYWGFLAGMDVSLQVTHTESFNYAVCERMSLGVPVLATHNIWLLSEDEFLRRHLCVDAPDTPQAIADRIDGVLADGSLRTELSERCVERISAVALENNTVAAEKIRELFSWK